MEVKLSQIAVHYLTPPASSVGIERFFSTAADIITDDRGGIDPYKAEKVLFCHENLPIIGYKYATLLFLMRTSENLMNLGELVFHYIHIYPLDVKSCRFKISRHKKGGKFKFLIHKECSHVIK